MKKSLIYYTLTLVFALWFMLTSFIWVYYINLFLSFPFGIISFLLWLKIQKKVTKTKRLLILYMLIIGVFLTIASLIMLL